MTVFTATPENPTGSSYTKRYTPEIGSLSSANITVKEGVKQRKSQIFLILYNFCESKIIHTRDANDKDVMNHNDSTTQ